jgi:hypothetical protein
MKKKEQKPKKKSIVKDNKEESTRFIKKAKEIQSEDGKEKFEKACGVIFNK